MGRIVAAMLGITILSLTLTGVFAAKPDGCQLTSASVTTVQGAIRDLAYPASGSRQGPVRLVVADSETVTKVRIGPPHALTTAGVTLTDGDAITVTGWLVTRDGGTWLIPRELTIGGTSLTLRSENGRPTWQRQRSGGK